MKAIINYFKRRREIKLRKWCIDQAMRVWGGESVATQAQNIYNWITTGQL